MAPRFDPTPLRGCVIRGIVGPNLFTADTGAASRADGSATATRRRPVAHMLCGAIEQELELT
jgi:hypothetical protein